MTGNVTLKPLTSFLDCPKTYIRTSYSATVAQVPSLALPLFQKHLKTTLFDRGSTDSDQEHLWISEWRYINVQLKLQYKHEAFRLELHMLWRKPDRKPFTIFFQHIDSFSSTMEAVPHPAANHIADSSLHWWGGTFWVCPSLPARALLPYPVCPRS